MQNTFKANEWQKIWVLKTFKTEIQKWEGKTVQPFCRIGSHQEIRSSLFNLGKFQKPETGFLSHAECIKI